MYMSMISQWRWQLKSAGRDSIRPSGMDLHTGLPAAHYVLETFFFFFLRSSLFGGATCSVSISNGGLTELTVSVYYLNCVLD